MEPLLGKRLVIIDDSRVERRQSKRISELMLKITANDGVVVNRKNEKNINTFLDCHFMLCSNEVPDIADASGAIATRFLMLETKNSFYNKEDHYLIDTLKLESEAILQRWIAALKRLNQKGAFVQPKSTKYLLEELRENANPIITFVRERCVIASDAKVGTTELYTQYTEWCSTFKYKAVNEKHFGRGLQQVKEVKGKVTRKRNRKGSEYTGIKLK